MKTFVQFLCEDESKWERLKRDFLSGIVYHGTTSEIANRIEQEGFRGLEFDEILKEILNKHGKKLEDLPKKTRKYLNQIKDSYEGEHHLVSTTPAGEVATRWAGGGGEVPKQVEAAILGFYSTRDVKSRISGEPAVVMARIKNFEATRGYSRVKHIVDSLERFIGKESTTDHVYNEQNAFDNAWHEYVNLHTKPEDLEFIRVIAGPDIEKLKQGPLP